LSDFISKDPRGYTVIFPSSTWGHARQHVIELGDARDEVLSVLSSPEMILDNQSNRFNQRSAIERYVGYSATINSHIVIPVKQIDSGLLLEEHGIEGEGRLAVTCFASKTIPHGKIKWRAKI
jgi:hypothetical protein